jgi:hypothetical protein
VLGISYTVKPIHAKSMTAQTMVQKRMIAFSGQQATESERRFPSWHVRKYL